METVEVEGLRITYERVGSGPPLVLLHGYVGDGRATWRQQLEGLSDEFTVISWDAPRGGWIFRSAGVVRHGGIRRLPRPFLSTIGLERAHVAGLSFGGALALELHRRHPALPLTLILASAYAGWGGSLPAETVGQRLRQALALANVTPPSSWTRSSRRCFPPRRPPSP